MSNQINPYLFRIVTVGETSVGKTSILNRFISEEFDFNERPTIGGTFLIFSQEIENKKIDLQIWDTAGQEKYRSLGPIYCRDASVGLIVFDITSTISFYKLKDWIKIFK